MRGEMEIKTMSFPNAAKPFSEQGLTVSMVVDVVPRRETQLRV
jgi:hypothetical protein